MTTCIRNAICGDPAATEAVVTALRPRLARLAAHYARRCGEDADDLLQEAWLGLLEALPHLDLTIGTPEQYLLQRARWRLLDAVRRSASRRCLPLEEAVAERAADPLPETAVGTACVREFTARLKSSQRAVLHCLLAGFTLREAGQILGCSSANVAYHVRQIRRQYVAWSE